MEKLLKTITFADISRHSNNLQDQDNDIPENIKSDAYIQKDYMVGFKVFTKKKAAAIN